MVNIYNNLSPWVNSLNEPYTHKQASFIEYLRWMRLLSENKADNSNKLLKLLEQVKTGDYSQNLSRLTQRTQRLATNSFVVECPWRIRVGGASGPESMLLPAFDALGMPYIPSSTLKGVARDIAKREGVSPEEIRKIFGDINPETSMGIVIFLDAYPLPGEDQKGGLCPDMANAIWTWDKHDNLEYQSKPNVFLSLLKPKFLIGLRQGEGCSEEILLKVKYWLLKGLIQGIGSRVNSGYGELKLEKKALNQIPREKLPRKNTCILEIPFELEGQLIHGYQRIYEQLNNPRLKAVPEIRPVAFRSMLRYWFRAFALGVLPISQVREKERYIFGGIEPKAETGLFQLEITKSNYSEPNYQSGTLILRHSPLTANDKSKRSLVAQLLNNLTWLMFHLGGVGQGARRAYYERPTNPRYRGINLTPKREEIQPERLQKKWQLPPTPEEFKRIFQQRLKSFYSALGGLASSATNYRTPLNVATPTLHTWVEAVDINCEIIVLRKAVRDWNHTKKTYPLEILHDSFHRLETNEPVKAKSLCGGIEKDWIGDGIERNVLASPVWIVNLHKYQVVTVFGATEGIRHEYLETLKQNISNSNIPFDSYSQIWPITENEN